MKTLLLTFIFFLTSKSALSAEFSKYPHGLLTPGHGIVTEDDLAYDAKMRDMSPYDPSIGGLYWQCFETKDVEYTYSKWQIDDGNEKRVKMVTMCAYEFRVKSKSDPQLFHARRGIPVIQCQNFEKTWRKLIKGQSIVCMNGEGGEYFVDEETGKNEKWWTWIKYKTKKGCDSYFAFECDTKGCSKGKCPEHKPVFD